VWRFGFWHMEHQIRQLFGLLSDIDGIRFSFFMIDRSSFYSF